MHASEVAFREVIFPQWVSEGALLKGTLERADSPFGQVFDVVREDEESYQIMLVVQSYLRYRGTITVRADIMRGLSASIASGMPIPDQTVQAFMDKDVLRGAYLVETRPFVQHVYHGQHPLDGHDLLAATTKLRTIDASRVPFFATAVDHYGMTALGLKDCLMGYQTDLGVLAMGAPIAYSNSVWRARDGGSHDAP